MITSIKLTKQIKSYIVIIVFKAERSDFKMACFLEGHLLSQFTIKLEAADGNSIALAKCKIPTKGSNTNYQ